MGVYTKVHEMTPPFHQRLLYLAQLHLLHTYDVNIVYWLQHVQYIGVNVSMYKYVLYIVHCTYMCIVRMWLCTITHWGDWITDGIPCIAVTSSWLLQGGHCQSTGEIPLSDSTAVGYCQAQPVANVLDVTYFVCKVNRTLVNASNAACFYERKLLQCCECGKTCTDVANLTTKKEQSSHSCRVETSVAGDLVCLGRKQIFDGSKRINVPSEFLGEFSVVNQPSPPSQTSNNLLIYTTSGGGGVLLLMIAIVLVIVVSCVVYWRRRRRRQPGYRYRQHYDEGG